MLEKARSPEDITSLMAVCFGAGTTEVWPEKYLQKLLDMPRTSAYLAMVSGNPAAGNSSQRPVGYAVGRMAADECELISIGVLPEFRRQGIAKILLDKIIRDCVGENMQKLFLEVQENNRPAKLLYKKYRFETVGHRKEYYKLQNGSFVDALTMSLKISGP